MKKTAILFATLLLFTCLCMPLKAQTTLVAGDIAFTGYIGNGAVAGTDEFSFVLLKDITTGTTITFTDNGWTRTTATTGTLRTDEGTTIWTSNAAYKAGTEIRIVVNATTATLVNGNNAGTLTTTTIMALSANGDQILAYQGTATSPTFISAIHTNVYTVPGDPVTTTAAVWDGIADRNVSSGLPAGLTTGVNAIWIGTEGDISSEKDNAYFNCAGDLKTVAGIKAVVYNQANWNKSDNAPGFTLPTGCLYLVNVGLTAAGTTSSFTTYDVTSGTDNGWTYYINDGKIVFQVFWNGNTTAKAAAALSITNGSMASATNTTPKRAVYTMGRYWNVDIGANTLAAGNVRVRFYYDASEKTNVVNAASSYATTNTVSDNGFKWFKTVGTAFAPASQVTANGIAGSPIQLTGTETSVNGVQQVEFSSISSLSGGTGTASAGFSMTPFPVNLLYFRAKATQTTEGNSVKLTWATASELNAQDFRLERSKDLKSFDLIGQLAAAGTTQEQQLYSFSDWQPLWGTSYYRLVQIDFDGTAHAYQPVAVILENQQMPFGVFPNPSTGRVLAVKVENSAEVRLTLYTLLGQQLPAAVAQRSDTILEMTPTSGLSAGTYFLRAEYAWGSKVYPFVVHP